MASAEREPITERGPGAEPLVMGSGVLKLNTFCVVIFLKCRKASMFMSCFMVINGSCSTNMCIYLNTADDGEATQLRVIQCDRPMATASGHVMWQLF